MWLIGALLIGTFASLGASELLWSGDDSVITTTELSHPFENFGQALEAEIGPASPTSTTPPTSHVDVVMIETRRGKQEIPITDNFYTSFATAFGMIMFSELGDKTFLIAAIMAMRHNRMKVFLATSAALTLMTVISVVAGRIIPKFVSAKFTKWIAALLFLIFGVMMVREGVEMAPDHLKEEYDEVVHEIEGERAMSQSNCSLEAMEAQSPAAIQPASASERMTSRLDLFFGGAISTIVIQIFSMVFLAEWGDRSQLATIVLAAAQNPWGVALGASAGHAACSLIAVWLGRALSSFLSIRSVTISGGILFILFAFITLI